MVEAEAQLADEVGQILAQMDELNEGEDREHGDDEGGGGLPQELQFREQRRERIRVARAQLALEKGEKLESQHQKSFADPEANMMKMGDGALGYCYNAQAATSEDGIIVATGLSAAANDVTELIPIIEAVEANDLRVSRGGAGGSRVLERGDACGALSAGSTLFGGGGARAEEGNALAARPLHASCCTACCGLGGRKRCMRTARRKPSVRSPRSSSGCVSNVSGCGVRRRFEGSGIWSARR